MAQLLVRKVEDAVVARLREEAVRERISVEEAHRRVLRRALLGEENEREPNFLDFLAQMPLPDEYDFIFEREKDVPRPFLDLEG